MLSGGADLADRPVLPYAWGSVADLISVSDYLGIFPALFDMGITKYLRMNLWES